MHAQAVPLFYSEKGWRMQAEGRGRVDLSIKGNIQVCALGALSVPIPSSLLQLSKDAC